MWECTGKQGPYRDPVTGEMKPAWQRYSIKVGGTSYHITVLKGSGYFHIGETSVQNERLLRDIGNSLNWQQVHKVLGIWRGRDEKA